MTNPDSLPSQPQDETDLHLELLAQTGATAEDLKQVFSDEHGGASILPEPGTPEYAEEQARLMAMRSPEEEAEYIDNEIGSLEKQFPKDNPDD